jgi:multidrug efflux pump subunit AcrA (membrane-fusion protein)
MRIFGKKIGGKKPLTVEQQEQRQAQERLANIKRIERERKAQAQQAKIAQRQTQQLKDAQRQAEYQSSLTKKERAITAQRQARQQRPSALKTIGAGVITGIKTMKRSARPSRQRSVYMSTSHGLKRIPPSDPMYAQYAAQQGAPPAQPTRAREVDDDWGTPSAFSSL